MQELGSEDTAYEDARAAWDWIAAAYPKRQRYIFGHSLGGAVAIDLAAQATDEQGTIVEGTFTSIADVAGTMRWGWPPIGPLITQRFESVRKVARVGAPLLVVHGADDNLIKSDLGRKLRSGHRQEALPAGRGRLALQHSTMAVSVAQYREALGQLFSLR